MTVETVGRQKELTQAEGLVSETPRLEAIEKPKGLKLRLLYWMTARRFGKVPTSIKVGVARAPAILGVASAMGKFESKGIHLDRELTCMINVYVAGTNGCGFCLDVGRMLAMKDGVNMEKLNALPVYRTSALFSDKERSALTYVEEVTVNKRVSDATFHDLQKYYSDRDIVEMTMITAMQNFTNLTNIPLGIGSDGFCLMAHSRKK
jgi:AhpD family alkylhydroperoxidase